MISAPFIKSDIRTNKIYALAMGLVTLLASLSVQAAPYMSAALLKDTVIPNAVQQIKNKPTNIESRLVGRYHLNAGGQSPSGSTTLFLLPDQHYVVIGFGEMMAGDWRVVRNKEVHLYPHNPKYPFVVFGRDNQALGEQSQITLYAENNGDDVLAYYGNIEHTIPTMSIINDKDSSYPYQRQYAGKASQLSFVHLSYNQNKENTTLYTFDTQGFNDFIVVDYDDIIKRRKPMRATIDTKNDALIFNWEGKVKRSALQLSEEEDVFIRKIVNMQYMPKTVHYDSKGGFLDKDSFLSGLRTPDLDNYTFDMTLNAYVKKDSCQDKCDLDAVDSNEIYYRYELLNKVRMQKSAINIEDTP